MERPTNRFPPTDGAFHINRRQILGGIAGASLSTAATLTGLPAFAQAKTGILKPVMISHVGFTVSDLKKSAEFYQKLFGFPPLVATTPASAQTYGFYFHDHFISLNQTPKEQAGRLTHYCIGVDNFQPERDGKILISAGFDGVKIDTSAGDSWVLLRDPDNNLIQIFDYHYTAPCPTCGVPPGGSSMPPPSNALLRPRKISHVGLTVADLKRSKEFYRKLFRLPANLRTLAPPAIPAYGLDFNGQFISLTLTPANGANSPGASKNYNKPGIITHYCIAVDNFNAKRDGARLIEAGFRNVRIDTDRIDCIYLPDPDGLTIQISDANYTYQCPTCEPPPV